MAVSHAEPLPPSAPLHFLPPPFLSDPVPGTSSPLLRAAGTRTPDLSCAAGGCGTLEPGEGSQRHLGLTRTTWPWGQDRDLTGAQSHQDPPWPGSLQPGQAPPLTSPKAAKQAQGKGSCIHVPPQGHPKPLRTSRVSLGGGWSPQHRDIGCWQWFGDGPSASVPQPSRSRGHGWGTSPCAAGSRAAGQRRARLERHGHLQNQHQTSTEAPAATGAPQCPRCRAELAQNSRLSSNSHTSSLPGPEQPAWQQDSPRQSQ